MAVFLDISLRPYNTFGIEARAAYFARVSQENDLRRILVMEEFRELPKLVLGGGSNLLFTRDFEGLVLQVDMKGIAVLEENAESVLLEVGAGEVWHDLVLYCVEQGWGGIENLSLIPGHVGAAPIQNIGAYGVELKDVFDHLWACNLETGELESFSATECAFGYRDSVFKREKKGKYVITSVALRLQKQPQLNTSYGAIEQELSALEKDHYTIRDVSQAVMKIRRSKLPDPAEIGNAGSFFKNPEVPKAVFDALKAEHPRMPGYVISDDIMKIPAGWLIQTAGWKGKRFGNFGVHDRQALVLVNFGGAAGRDIYELSETILRSVQTQFGIELEREVNVV